MPVSCLTDWHFFWLLNTDKISASLLLKELFGVGTFPVLSGRQKFINNVNCSYVTDYGSIPVGDYWIVKMPSSGFANTVLRELKDLVNHTNHDEWFGLFSVRTISDSVFVNGVNADSLGCIH